MTPEEFKEKRKERNRQYQLKNKEVLKEKRKIYLKGKVGEKNREYQRNLRRKWRQENPLPERILLTEEEKKERKREYEKSYRQNMTEEQNEKRREINLNSYYKHKEKRKEYMKRYMKKTYIKKPRVLLTEEEKIERSKEYKRKYYKKIRKEYLEGILSKYD